MSNHNITQPGTQETGLGVMIGSCSPDSQHGWPERHPANADRFFYDTRMTTKETPTTRDLNAKHGLGKTINLHYIAILGATLHKEDIDKEWLRSGKNMLVFRQVKFDQ